MFKLVKILGANSNVPELIRVPMSDVNNLYVGHMYYVDNGKVMSIRDHDYAQLICSMQEIYLEDGAQNALCFLVTPEMVFEASVENKPSYITVGQQFKMAFGDEEEGVAIRTDLSDGDEVCGIIVNTNSYASTGKVLVKFHCIKGAN